MNFHIVYKYKSSEMLVDCFTNRSIEILKHYLTQQHTQYRTCRYTGDVFRNIGKKPFSMTSLADWESHSVLGNQDPFGMLTLPAHTNIV